MQLQAYLLGCSFDTYTPTWHSRSYILVLIVLAWMLPLGVIGSCYCQIFQSVKNNMFVLSNGRTTTSDLQRARKVLHPPSHAFKQNRTYLLKSNQCCTSKKRLNDSLFSGHLTTRVLWSALGCPLRARRRPDALGRAPAC